MMYQLQERTHGRWSEPYIPFESSNLEAARTVLAFRQAEYPLDDFRLISYEVVTSATVESEGPCFVEYNYGPASQHAWQLDGSFGFDYPKGTSIQQARQFIRDDRAKWGWSDDSQYRIVNSQGEEV
jgi:hypothetical protein